MDNELPAPNPPAVNNVEAYLAMLNGVEDLPMPATINNNVEYYLRKLVEGGGGGGGIPTTVIDTIWFGTQEAYDLIDPKATKTLYLVQEDVETPVSLSLNAIRNVETLIDRPTVTPTIEPKLNIAKAGDTSNSEEIPEELLANVEEEPEVAEQIEETPEIETTEEVEEPEEELTPEETTEEQVEEKE